MKFLVLFLMVLYSLNFSQTKYPLLNDAINKGDFTIATQMIDSLISNVKLNPIEVYSLTFQKELFYRIKKDFGKTKEAIVSYLIKYYPNLEDQMLETWEREKSLEMKIIDGEKRYFNYACQNFFRINKEARIRKEKVDGKKLDDLDEFLKIHIPSVIKQSKNNNERFINPVHMNINYTITLKPNVVPEGEVVRCWLPFPRETKRQKNIMVNKINTDKYIISNNADFRQRSLYLEKIVEKDKPLVFSVELNYTSYAEFNEINFEQEFKVDPNSDIFKKYTEERPPHIVFNDEIKTISKQIVGEEKNLLKKVKLIYEWIDKNIPWASALEYSTIPNISSYCLNNKHGDCGIQTILFITLARLNGIPARWQSGWMMHPPEINLHDWCEIYFDELGWIPVDQSFGLQNLNSESEKYFYLGSIDSYRLIVNDEYSEPFYPSKIYPRSETVDFQRGELEWRGGNLYFDQWNYDMKINYINESELEK
jgi:transglutaminase-like putative cysteine protease